MARNNIPSDPRSPQHASQADAARPGGSVWEALMSEGIEHESQVLIVGFGSDLPARLIVTKARLVLVSDGEIAIEVPRGWLHPSPRLAAENGIRIYITPTGSDAGDTETLSIRARGGRGAALEVIGAIAGRALPKLDQPSRPSLPAALPAEPPARADRATASRSLPPLPDFAQIMQATAPRQEPATREIRRWPPVETEGVAAPIPSPATPASPSRTATAATPTQEAPPREVAGWRFPVPSDKAAPTPPPVPSAVSRAARRQGTLADGHTISDEQFVPDAHQNQSLARRSIVWTLRIAILLVILGTSVYLGRDYLRSQARDLDLPLPNGVERELGITHNPGVANDNDQVSQLAASDDSNPTIPATRGDNVLDGVSATTDPNSASTEPTATEAPVDTAVPTDIPPTDVPPTDVPPTEVPPTDVPPTDVPPTDVPPTDVPAIAVPPTDVPPTPTEVPPTATTVPPTATTVPPTATNVPPTETPQPTVTPKPTREAATNTPAPTATATDMPTQAPTETPQPTTTPTLAPTQTPQPTDTPAPTATVTPQATETPTVEPTTAPTTAPTQTQVPTDTATTQPTVTPGPTHTPTIAPTPTLVPQKASVDPKATPDQQFSSAGFRYSIDGASFGSSVPDLPQIATIDYGDWLVLSVTAENVTTSDQVFDMSSFKLLADGQEVNLDTGTQWANGMLGYSPAYGNVSQITWAAGESHQFALVFLAPVDAKSLILEAGDQQIDLTTSVKNLTSLETAKSTPESIVPTTVDAKVVKVINAETIVVDINGRQQTVRYLGVDAPEETDCYAKQATDANASLVEGKTVRIERQATNVDARGNWVRDVWAPDKDGTYQLVANSLIAEGAAKANISVPNTRFADWLTATQRTAQSQGAGLWKACSDEAPDTTPTPAPSGVTTTSPVAIRDIDRLS